MNSNAEMQQHTSLQGMLPTHKGKALFIYIKLNQKASENML